MQVLRRRIVAYLASFVAVSPFFRAKVAPFFRDKDKPQTGTVKLIDKALCKLASIKDTALSAYLHRTGKTTAWYKRFPPSIAWIAPRTPRRPRLTVPMGRGSPEDEEDVAERPVASESLSDEADDDSTRAGNEARSAQLFLALSDIAWYIAGAGCYITPFISGVLYS